MSASKIRQWNAEEITYPEMGELPSDWKWSTIGDEITELKGGLGTKKSDYIDSGVLLFNKGNVTTYGRTLFEGKRKYVSAKFFAKHKKHAVEPGNLVVTLRDLSEKADFLGLVGTYRQTEPALLSQGACVVEPGSRLHAPFLAYYSNSPFYRTAAKANKNGTTQVHLRNGQFGAIPIPLPPLPEQRHIVARIDELFSRLDAGVAALRHAKAQLNRYRQSVLAAAVTGQLTQPWREQHPDTESAEELLERILKLRREEWDGKGKYKEPVLPDDISVYALPKSWSLATIDQLQSRVQYGSSTKTNSDDAGVPVLRMGNILEGALIWNSLKFLPCDHSEFPELLLESGDLLFNRTNSPELVGKTAVFRSQRNPCSFASYLIRVRFLGGIFPEFVAAFINSHFGRAWIKSVVSQQVGQANVNGTKLRGVTLPLPPLAEQHQIVAEVEARTTVIDHLEAELDRQITRSNSLRQSTLAAAFSGSLKSSYA